ncbi:MAG: hypothetical protein AMJ89_04920 [candidate division Zixibacteria bacterium SM23_73]|nr:MAG: hypothetical protein AMJ89_04920 [candidate division Zixibacteria bacterium SM23_73]
MKISYDPKADALYIQFQEGKVGKTKKVEEGILIDLDNSGKIFGIEIIGLSERMSIKDLGHISFDLPLAKVG